MELFRGVNIDWMGKAKYFITLSLVLLAIGWISVWRNHGLAYGVDFRGGTDVVVRFSTPPPVDRIRSGLENVGLRNCTITPITDFSDANSKNDLEISLDQNGQSDAEIDADRQAVIDALHKTFPTANGKPDFNTVSPPELSKFLVQQDPLKLGLNAGDRYAQLAQALTGERDKVGVITNFNQLSSAAGVTPAVINALSANYDLGSFTPLRVVSIGPKVGSQLRLQALRATLYALAGMLVYIAFRFEWVYGAAAVIAVFHDVLITLGFFSLRRYEISLTVIAALLTLVGYSMNDTIVIFDRVRENLRLMRREAFPDIVNKSINQTLSRTILTSGLTLLTVLVLYLLGGEVLRAFSFAMVAGVVVGTYSSFGIAAPIVVFWNKYRGQGTAVRAGSAAEKRAPAAGR